LNLELTPAVSIHSPIRSVARVAKRDNFVVAVFNINENVSAAFINQFQI
jgi:hypothetical protein